MYEVFLYLVQQPWPMGAAINVAVSKSSLRGFCRQFVIGECKNALYSANVVCEPRQYGGVTRKEVLGVLIE